MASPPPSAFRVALTRDFYDADGACKFDDIGFSVLDEPAHIERFTLDEHRAEITPDQYGDANGIVVLTPTVTAASLGSAENLLAIGRFGVGYDNVDLSACTAADVLLLITKGAVDRPVGEATVGWMIALTHHMRIKDQLVRDGNWDARTNYMGTELRDRTFGAVGLGGIARETIRLLSSFRMKQPIAFDPMVSAEAARELGVELVELDDLMRRADFVSVHCPLNDQTRDLIGRPELELMKASAFLINTARGGIVNEDALFDVLEQRRIAGAALDCFVGEPVTSPHRFGTLDNVQLAPHCICWTDEFFRDAGTTAFQSMVSLSFGRPPHGMINPEVLERPGFAKKWERWRGE